MNELKPCPFCGGEAELNESASGLPYFSIWCKNENCIAGAVQVRDFDKERLVNAWNTRAERTCRYICDGKKHAFACDKCGCLEPCSDRVNYCCDCGAKVVDE